MKPVFGFGIAREEHFSLLPPTLPDEFSFLEVPGEILESRKICADLERYSARQRKAVVIRDVVQSYLADSAPFFPLHLKVEFDRKFRERCEAAARLKCRIISADFNLARALGDPVYKKNLLNLLRSIAGILDEFKFIMLLPLYFPADACSKSFAEFLSLKKELFYPGFRFLLNYRFHEEGAGDMLNSVVSDLSFERHFWRLSYMPDSENLLRLEELENMRPFWENIPGNTPAYVCFEPGVIAPDQIMINDLAHLLKKYRSAGRE